MKKFILILISITFILTACTLPVKTPSESENAAITIEDSYISDSIIADNEEPSVPMTYELMRTGEFYTTDQIETLKTEALSWQSTVAGIGGFAIVVVIEPLDSSDQQVFISIDRSSEFLNGFSYEKMQIQSPDGAEARIFHVSSGGGSGELMVAYKFVTEDSEWVELFYIWRGDLTENIDIWETGGKWVNLTESDPYYIEFLSELPPEERTFK